MLRALAAVVFVGFSGAALACEDAAPRKTMAIVDDGVPNRTVAQPVKDSEKNALPIATPEKVKSDQPASKTRAPKGKPLA